MEDIRNRKFRLPPVMVPSRLRGKKFHCGRCDRDFEIDWHSPLAFPAVPLSPPRGNGHWVRIAFSQTCPNGHATQIDVPVTPTKGHCELYGDEAGREFDEGELPGSASRAHFFCYTLVGATSKISPTLLEQIRTIKQQIRPSHNPDDWGLHITKIKQNSIGKNGFSFKRRSEKEKFYRQFAALISKSRPELFSHTLCSCRILMPGEDWPDMVNNHMVDVFSRILLASLEQVREKELSVHWNFDHKVDSDERTGTEEWAEEAFLGLQYTPLFTWLTAGAAEHQATFHTPGSHFLLEIADAISFFVAREFKRRAKNRKSEVSSSDLGKALYQAVTPNGGLAFEWSEGLPYKKFYPQLQLSKS